MGKCDHCPIDGACFGERKPFACKFGLPDANRTRRRYLADKSAALDGREPESAYPPLAAQAKNLAGSVVRFVASGFATVDQSEFDRRRAICLACPTGRYDAAEDRCRACGCNVSIKPWGKAEACPDGHW